MDFFSNDGAFHMRLVGCNLLVAISEARLPGPISRSFGDGDVVAGFGSRSQVHKLIDLQRM
jgi:hypothetical protein